MISVIHRVLSWKVEEARPCVLWITVTFIMRHAKDMQFSFRQALSNMNPPHDHVYSAHTQKKEGFWYWIRYQPMLNQQHPCVHCHTQIFVITIRSCLLLHYFCQFNDNYTQHLEHLPYQKVSFTISQLLSFADSALQTSEFCTN